MSEDTKRRIIDATLQTLRSHGASGTSARAIAKAGGFNTSLLFYHFGSVEGALLAAARADTEQRIERYSDRLGEVASLPELVTFANEMHRENLAAGHVTVLVQMLAATSAHPDIREELATVFDPWIDLVRDTLDRLVGPDGIAGISTTDVAVGATSLFLGLELVTHLGDRYGRAASLLDALDEAADLLVALGALEAAAPDGAATGLGSLAALAGPRSRTRTAPADQLADLPGPRTSSSGVAPGTPPPSRPS